MHRKTISLQDDFVNTNMFEVDTKKKNMFEFDKQKNT